MGQDNNGIREELIRQIAVLQNRMGNLEGKVDLMQGDISEIKKDVKNLNSFRWKTYGAVAALGFFSGMLGAIVTLITHIAHIK